MYYINEFPNESGNHGNPTSFHNESMVVLPDKFLNDYITYKGFVIITTLNGAVDSLEINQEAYDAYMANHPDLEQIKWKAKRDFEPGEYMTIDDVMYRVLLPILAGSKITVGTNVEATTIEAEMRNLNKEES